MKEAIFVDTGIKWTPRMRQYVKIENRLFQGEFNEEKTFSEGLKAKIVLAAAGFCAGTVPVAKKQKKSPGKTGGFYTA